MSQVQADIAPRDRHGDDLQGADFQGDDLQGGGLRPGDALPFCYGMGQDQRYWSFEEQAGRPCVLIRTDSLSPAATADLIEAFAASAPAFAARGADIGVLATAGAPGWATARAPAGVMLVHCMDGLATDGERPRVVVADRALRLVAVLDPRDPAQAVLGALAALDTLARPPMREMRYPAPVLVVPGVLDAQTCVRLIARFEGGDHRDGAMASVDADGVAIRRVDAGKKHRRDLELAPGEPLHDAVLGALSGRLVPEIARAFQVQVVQLDRILIARYDDAGGYFRRHRDNASAHLAYREFAVSLNLNAGDYDGGCLRFPEYADDLYAPPSGAGCVFSASLLHEATPVTRGRRYVLLSFLHSAAAEARRLAALETGGAVTP